LEVSVISSILIASQHLAPAASALDVAAQVPVVLYVGPDQIMPLTSVLGAIIGLALMFWNYLMGLARRTMTFLGRRSEPTSQDQPIQ
jgi:hypothetical protein